VEQRFGHLRADPDEQGVGLRTAIELGAHGGDLRSETARQIKLLPTG
jgi:hypothetical protein